jgi:hypothetical protein
MRVVPLYALLVGVPLAILLPVLRIGRTLTAPPAVAGEWLSESGDRVHVDQSGTFVQLRVSPRGAGEMRMEGRIHDRDLRATAPGPGTLPCDASGELVLRVRFADGARPTAAAAELQSPGACGIAPVRLVRGAGE